jgi:UDPglucose 6-dehydrogenase/GDP-mannose 6-dehydrogenase
MRVSIIGTGYVGLVTGACLAASGHVVTCVDIRPDVVSTINNGKTPIFEEGLQELMEPAVAEGRLRATTDLDSAVWETEVTLVCVGTPNNGERMDLAQIIAAAESIGKALGRKHGYHVVAVKSTVLPGTSEGIFRQTIEAASGRQLGDGWGLCMNPEFLREGRAVKDCLVPDRVVIGASDAQAANVLLDLYNHQDCPKVVTSPKTAEMIKYVANSLFATLISFSNEMANICSAIPGVDAREVWKGVHLDRRLTARGQPPADVVEYLWHGLGFGGSCFPKDVMAVRGFGKELGESTEILDAVLHTNAVQPLRIVRLLEREMELRDSRVAVLGLAFKPGTDDIRESPAIPVIDTLVRRGAQVVVHDPVAISQAQSHALFQKVTFAEDWSTALTGADGCCLITSWQDYKKISPGDFVRLMKRPLVVDGRGMYDPAAFAAEGAQWRGIGFLRSASLQA